LNKQQMQTAFLLHEFIFTNTN